MIFALRNSVGNTKETILKYIDQKDFSPENIHNITRFVHENGGVAYAEDQMELYKNKAIEELNGFADGDVKKSLILCAEFAASRSN